MRAAERAKLPPPPPDHIADSCDPHCRWCWEPVRGIPDDPGWIHAATRRSVCEGGEHVAEPVQTTDQWRAQAARRKRWAEARAAREAVA